MATGLFKNAKVSGAATSLTTLYTTPSGKYATVHSIFITNKYNLEDLYVNVTINDAVVQIITLLICCLYLLT